ncbi:MAG: CDP-alcohol phosphatidyltransferase family protein [Mucilaginibacter sp.]
MNTKVYRLVNILTYYRLAAAPLLLWLLIDEQPGLFKWLLAFSFLTDAIDGFLARKFKVTSVLGARLDSVADDLTIAVAILGIVLYRPDFLRTEWVLVAVIVFLYMTQNSLALIRYRKLTSFHTYTAKIAAVFQAGFLLLFYFSPGPMESVFYFAAALTIADLAEEIALTLLLPTWEADVKGLFWMLKRKQRV